MRARGLEKARLDDLHGTDRPKLVELLSEVITEIMVRLLELAILDQDDLAH